jgi:hypothetical protein
MLYMHVYTLRKKLMLYMYIHLGNKFMLYMYKINKNLLYT